VKGGHSHGHSHGHKGEATHGELVEDPHWWHSIGNVQRATKIVRDALIKLRPEDKALFSKNADEYIASLATLQKWVKSELAKLPRNQRKLVTSHDAFQYFAKENGFTIHAVEGLSSAEQPSSKQVADIIKLIKAQGVKAIFAETIENPKVLQEITRETGAKMGGELYADGLGEGEASTFEGMVKHNVRTIVEGLEVSARISTAARALRVRRDRLARLPPLAAHQRVGHSAAAERRCGDSSADGESPAGFYNTADGAGGAASRHSDLERSRTCRGIGAPAAAAISGGGDRSRVPLHLA
jgi:hypothetical protein